MWSNNFSKPNIFTELLISYQTPQFEQSSYIKSFKWCNFIKNKDYYLNQVIEIRDNRKNYNLTKGSEIRKNLFFLI